VQEFVHLCVCKTERQRDRETERQRDRETERQRGREAERQRDKTTERETERDFVDSIESSIAIFLF
jgi:hypothetical protein